MSDPIHDQELLAYADGELNEDRRAAVQRALAENPNLAAKIDELTQLRKASRQAIHNATPKAPDSLRQMIADLDIDSEPIPFNDKAKPINDSATRHKTWPWRTTLSAVAAMLLIVVGASLYVMSLNSNTNLGPIQEKKTYTLAQLAESVTNKHLACSTLEDHFIDPDFPRSVSDLGPAAEKFMSQPVLTPDLSSIGYEFAGAGPCHVPGGQTLHLLYQSTETGNFISLFSQLHPWKIDLEDGHHAIGAGPDAEHPMLIWRSGGIIYFLVCDDFGACEKAAKAMGLDFQS